MSNLPFAHWLNKVPHLGNCYPLVTNELSPLVLSQAQFEQQLAALKEQAGLTQLQWQITKFYPEPLDPLLATARTYLAKGRYELIEAHRIHNYLANIEGPWAQSLAESFKACDYATWRRLESALESLHLKRLTAIGEILVQQGIKSLDLSHCDLNQLSTAEWVACFDLLNLFKIKSLAFNKAHLNYLSYKAPSRFNELCVYIAKQPLTALYMQHNDLNDLDEVASDFFWRHLPLEGLQHLDLDYNTSIKTFNVAKSKVYPTGAFWTHFVAHSARLKNLHHLSLNHNNLGLGLPEKALEKLLRDLTSNPLVSLQLSHNALGSRNLSHNFLGFLFDTLAKATRLRNLCLSDNVLNDAPSQFWLPAFGRFLNTVPVHGLDLKANEFSEWLEVEQYRNEGLFACFIEQLLKSTSLVRLSLDLNEFPLESDFIQAHIEHNRAMHVSQRFQILKTLIADQGALELIVRLDYADALSSEPTQIQVPMPPLTPMLQLLSLRKPTQGVSHPSPIQRASIDRPHGGQQSPWQAPKH